MGCGYIFSLHKKDQKALAHVDEEYGLDRKALDEKIQELSDTESTALIIWASAYWLNSSDWTISFERYINNY